MLKKVMIGFVLLLLALVAFSFTLPRFLNVHRDIMIEADVDYVFSFLNDLRNWPKWTAWAERDPDMTLKFSENSIGVGAYQKWFSNTQGQGELTITLSELNERIEYDLYFADWDSTAQGVLLLEEESQQVKVIWQYKGDMGNNPVMRLMGPTIFESMIALDFEAGLENLKSLIELKAEKSEGYGE